MWRSRKLLDSARGHGCQAPGCGRDDGTIVAAHSNQGRHGKGGALKAHDCFVAFLCARCHAYVDTDSKASQADRTAVWMGGFIRSVPLFRRFLDDEAWAMVQQEVMQ